MSTVSDALGSNGIFSGHYGQSNNPVTMVAPQSGTAPLPYNPGTNNPYLQGMPNQPAFTYDWTPEMSMLPAYEQEVANNNQGFQDYFNQATEQGPSAWATLAMNQQGAQAQNQREQAQTSTAANTASADDALAMQGGLSSGARERVQEAGATNATNATQNITRQEGLNDMQIGVNDAQNKMQELSQIPGMEQAKVSGWQSVNAQDTANQVAENQAYNAYQQNAYNQQATMWAAGQQATATQNSAPKK